MKSFSIFFFALCILLTACKKADTDSSHITANITYTPPAPTMYDDFSLNSNITVTLTSAQHQIVNTATLTRAGTADLGVQPAGSYIIVAVAEERDNAYGATLYRTVSDSCTLSVPGSHQCSIELHPH